MYVFVRVLKMPLHLASPLAILGNEGCQYKGLIRIQLGCRGLQTLSVHVYFFQGLYIWPRY